MFEVYKSLPEGVLLKPSEEEKDTGRKTHPPSARTGQRMPGRRGGRAGPRAVQTDAEGRHPVVDGTWRRRTAAVTPTPLKPLGLQLAISTLLFYRSLLYPSSLRSTSFVTGLSTMLWLVRTFARRTRPSELSMVSCTLPNRQ